MYFNKFKELRWNKLIKPSHNLIELKELVEKYSPYITLVYVNGKGYCLEFYPENQRIYLANIGVKDTLNVLKGLCDKE